MSTTSHYSPTDDSVATPGGGADDLTSPQPLARRATIGDPVYDNQAISRQRRKAAVVACERCRRRKIRCDGSQPCVTCARFGVRCARPEERRERSNSNAEHAALADRVKMLEARLAAVSASDQPFPGNEAMEGPSSRPGPPSLHLDTSFTIADHSRSYSFDGGMHDEISMADDLMGSTLSVPTISITGPNGSVPSSPLALSPSPSLFSGTSRASSPDPFSATSFDYGPPMLGPGPQGFIRTPPLSQWADVYDQRNEMLRTPGSPGYMRLSRQSSVSSFGGLGEGLCAITMDEPVSPQTNWNSQEDFDASMHFDHGSGQLSLPDPTPDKAHAEALADQVFNFRNMPLDRTAFRLCLEAVYDTSGSFDGGATPTLIALSTYTPYSFRMARSLVYLTLAIGLRMYGAAGGSSAGVENCYTIALQQMQTVDFWAETGSQEVASLFSTFGEVSRN